MNEKTRLILGDTLAIAILTVIGFASHAETGLSFIPRMGTTFFPLVIGWFLIVRWRRPAAEQTTPPGGVRLPDANPASAPP